MQRVLVLRQAVAHASASPEDNPSILAHSHMGSGLSGALQNGPWRLQAHPGGGGQIHQMYRGLSYCQRYVEGGDKVHRRHHPPVRGPQ
jgi:hypothetical protein